MTARSEYAAANGRATPARFPVREIAAIVGVVFSATGALIVGMQWAISNNLGPLFLTMQSVESQLLSIRENVDGLRVDVDGLRVDVGVLRAEVNEVRGEVKEVRGEVKEVRAEVGELRGQFSDLRERVAKVETGLEQVQANQVRIFDILEHGPNPRE